MKTASQIASVDALPKDADDIEGERIARAIFRCGGDANSPCMRIQFKAGKWPDAERDQGGLVERSLARLIAECLRDPKRGI